MTISSRRFILSMCITLIVAMFLTGIYAVTSESENIGNQQKTMTVTYNDIILIGKVADNAITFLSPETKAAAHWMLIVCAALSKLYL